MVAVWYGAGLATRGFQSCLWLLCTNTHLGGQLMNTNES